LKNDGDNNNKEMGINTWLMFGHSRGKKKKREAWESLEKLGENKKIKGKPCKFVRDKPPKY
jgi:hypothetical protein